jgi:hypothetical protein
VLKGSAGNFQGLTIEKGYTDISQYATYKGCRINTMAISLVQEGFHEITFGFIGKTETLGDTTAITSASTPVGGTKSGFTGYQCVISTTMRVGTAKPGDTALEGGISSNGSYYDLGFVTGGNISINNNIETDGYVLGSSARASAQYGKRSCSGDFTTFFQDAKLYALYAAGTECGIKFTFDNGIGQKLEIEFPVCKLSGSAPEIASFQGLNMSINFSARYDNTKGADVIVTLTNTLASIEAGTE